MCGDIESDESIAEEHYRRFVERTQTYLSPKEQNNKQSTDTLYIHLDALFRKTLVSITEPDNVSQEVTGYERLSMEPLVYARLAGFIAAHQPLEDDPLKRLIEALMTGYAEGESTLVTAHNHSAGH
jgi:hypothetical protein